MVPGQPPEQPPGDGLYQRLAGKDTLFVLLTVGGEERRADEEERLQLERKGFSELAVFEVPADVPEEKIERIALEIRKKILAIQIDM